MKPKIICHMASSADGRIVTERWSMPFDGKERNQLLEPYFKVGQEFGAQAWLMGLKTVRELYCKNRFEFEKYVPAAGFKIFIGDRDTGRFGIITDPYGEILYESNTINGSNIITLLSENVSEEYLSYLRELGISYVFAGSDGSDMTKAMQIIGSEFGIEVILLKGGGITNGTFLKAGLIDELSLMIYPGLDGLMGIPSITDYPGEKNEFQTQGQSMELIHCTLLDNGVVWLFYRIHKNK